MKTEHINLASNYRYHGGNALILEAAFQANAWTERHWATKAQAEKRSLQLEPGAVGVTVMLNERKFTVYNSAQMVLVETSPIPDSPFLERSGHTGPEGDTPDDAPTTRKSAKVLTFRQNPAAAKSSYEAFRDALPNRANGWPREARAFFNGLPNGGTYQAHMGTPRGEFIHAALQFLAEHGDSEGRRYTLQLEQVGWAFFSEADKKGRPLKAPELHATTGMHPQVSEEDLQRLQEKGLAQPTYRMHLQPATAKAVA